MSESEDRIIALEREGKLTAVRHQATMSHPACYSLSNPSTGAKVLFYSASGIVVRANVKQFRKGLDAALRLIGVRA